MHGSEMKTAIALQILTAGAIGFLFILIGIYAYLHWLFKLLFILIGLILLVSVLFGFKNLGEMRYG